MRKVWDLSRMRNRSPKKISAPSDSSSHLRVHMAALQDPCESWLAEAQRTSAYEALANLETALKFSCFVGWPCGFPSSTGERRLSTKTSRDRARLLPTERAPYYHASHFCQQKN